MDLLTPGCHTVHFLLRGQGSIRRAPISQRSRRREARSGVRLSVFELKKSNGHVII